MNRRQALAFVKRHGLVLMSGRGPVPNLAEAIAGEAIRGSWWGHPKSHRIFAVSEALCDSDEILRCRLVGGKVTLVHRRLWPALVRLGLEGLLPKRGLAAIREEHTARGHHRTVATPFARRVPRPVLVTAKRLSPARAIATLGPGAAGGSLCAMLPRAKPGPPEAGAGMTPRKRGDRR